MRRRLAVEQLEPRLALSGLVAHWTLDEGSGSTAHDTSPEGVDNSSVLVGNPQWSSEGLSGALTFDGIDDLVQVLDSADINQGIHGQRTIALWFRANDTSLSSRKQVLFEEGAGARGLNIYLHDGKLYVGGWNQNESKWNGTYLATDEIESGKWHHVVLVLDGNASVESGALRGYLDGQLYGSGEGSQLWGHAVAAIGRVDGKSRFHDGKADDDGDGFAGLIDDIRVYNEALLQSDIAALFNQGSSPVLKIEIPDSLISENGGVTTATVSRTGSTAESVEVFLQSSNTAEAVVPASIVISAGQSAAEFQITGVDDNDMDGTQQVNVTATAAGHQPAMVAIGIADDEVPDTLLDQLFAHWSFDEGNGLIAGDTSPHGVDNSGTLIGNPQWAPEGINGSLRFNGDGDAVSIPSSVEINSDVFPTRTIALWFRADDVAVTSRKQVLFEEGGGARGLNLYLYAGKLYVGGWNQNESQWNGTYLSTNQVQSNRWHHVALVLNGNQSVQPGALQAYLDGKLFGSGDGSQLWGHDSAMIGRVDGRTRFYDGKSVADGDGMSGLIDEVRLYNRALTPVEIAALASQTSSGGSAAIEGIVWDDADGDGVRDDGEAGIGDSTVFLDLNENGELDAGEPSQLTAADGGYSFTGLVSGSYTVVQIVPAGFAQTFPNIGAKRVAAGLDSPLFATSPPEDFDRLFILEKDSGKIKILDLNTTTMKDTPFLTIDDLSTNGSRGLLGMAFDPDYQSNGFFYVYYVDASSTAVIERYHVSGDPDLAEADSGLTILRGTAPQDGHFAGWLDFGLDGYLYIATGDGGGGGNDPGNDAQDITDNLLGKILRIDVHADDFPGDENRNYGIPSDNPFVGVAGDDEIWAYGLRNPWRNSFDRATGDLYIADVGQDAREEINLQLAGNSGGQNYGWRLREGSIATATDGVGGDPPVNNVNPLYEYPHDGGPIRGMSITGGYVYRGPIASLQGKYFFADFIRGGIWSIEHDGASVHQVLDWTSSFTPDVGTFDLIASLGEDSAGNLYLIDFDGEVFQIVTTGAAAGHVVVLGEDATAIGIDFGNRLRPNALPLANDDSYSTVQNTTLSIPTLGVLANDSDADGDSLSAVLVSAPAHGSLTLNSDGSLIYTPGSDFVGSDQFSYVAHDGVADSNEATVTINVLTPVVAFPGAEGFGAMSVGGRGGRVIEVTNLNDSGPGSLREALEAEGPRIVVFHVGGNIVLESGITVSNPYLTLAGQTAPGDGISLVNGQGNVESPLRIETHDVIIRYIRSRPGTGGEISHALDAITITNSSYNVIVDHASLSWSVDEVFNTWSASHHITLQWTVLSESLHDSTHVEGPHGMGALFGDQQSHSISAHHNFFAHNNRRNPQFNLGGVGQFINNVIYNYGDIVEEGISTKGVSMAKGDSLVNYVANYIIPGPESVFVEYYISGRNQAQFYVEGNITPLRPSDNSEELVGVVRPEDFHRAVTEPFAAPPVTTTSAIVAFDEVLADAGNSAYIDELGNWVARRDVVDQRVINDVINGTGSIIDDPSQVGGWPVLEVGVPPLDSDHDGMPDAWELAWGLNPSDAADGSLDPDGDGYTNVEDYLNGVKPVVQ